MIKRFSLFVLAAALCACGGGNTGMPAEDGGMVATPTTDYVAGLDVYSSANGNSFLNQLAMNYRSYAMYNAETSGYPDIAEQFAAKSVAAFSGETPYPERLENWPVADGDLQFELQQGYDNLNNALNNDFSLDQPLLAAEAQAKFDCWLSASASGQMATANECHNRFDRAMNAFETGNGEVIEKIVETEMITETSVNTAKKRAAQEYYPETAKLRAANRTNRTREGVVIVNNVNIPENLIKPVPVQPMVFNQNIYGGDKSVSNSDSSTSNNNSNNISVPGQKGPAPQMSPCQPTYTNSAPCAEPAQPAAAPELGDEYVRRDEFINMMLALRADIAAINARLDKIPNKPAEEKTILKVQQIPLEPRQRVMEEIFEIRFDFNRAEIKPEYEAVIRKLVATTQENRNVKISVVGHTDTVGTNSYNYALGGRRAEQVRNMLIQYGIPGSQIVAVSSGKTDPKVPTGDQVKNAENRRVNVIKEVHYTEPAAAPEYKLQEITRKKKEYKNFPLPEVLIDE
ncbi:MAG: OmpA family protein [Rickettsiales bacterium]|jgi:peptidoglycan-associated lipoprotein|nr:OmpA family protein [Rickettsiales bacterium]